MKSITDHVMTMDRRSLDSLQRAITMRRKELKNLPLHNMFTLWTISKPIFKRLNRIFDGDYSVTDTTGRLALAADKKYVVIMINKGVPWGTTIYNQSDFK